MSSLWEQINNRKSWEKEHFLQGSHEVSVLSVLILQGEVQNPLNYNLKTKTYSFAALHILIKNICFDIT